MAVVRRSRQRKGSRYKYGSRASSVTRRYDPYSSRIGRNYFYNAMRNRDSGHVLRTKRSVALGNVAVPSSANTNAYGAIQFRLSDLPNYTDFTSVFDQYMITYVEVKFVPDFSNNQTYWRTDTNATVSDDLPTLITWTDFDDAVTPASEAAGLSNESHLIKPGGEVHVRKFTPRVATTYWQSAVASGYGTGMFKWLDTGSSPSVSHYGLKYAIVGSVTGGPSAPQWQYRVYVTMHLKFKKVIG